jgi:hypothetical protein
MGAILLMMLLLSFCSASGLGAGSAKMGGLKSGWLLNAIETCIVAVGWPAVAYARQQCVV